MFKLVGVVLHRLFGPETGHCKVILKLDNEWNEFVDRDVTKVSVKSVIS
jgi:hypothetical protein